MSLVLLLRQRGRMTAEALAEALEVSTRTVLRDVGALSSSGVPIYAERGRHGGFALLPGFRTELTGLNHEEALALLVAGSVRGEQVFGLGSALAAAMRKVVDALPPDHQEIASDATSRLLIDPDSDLLSRRATVQEVSDPIMVEVRRAVLTGHRLRIRYAATGQEPQWRTIDPIGLVTVRDRGYLLAIRAGVDRTYRLSRLSAAEVLPERSQRPEEIDLARIWQQRREQFLADDHVTAMVRVAPARREELLNSAVDVRAEQPSADGWPRLELTFQDDRHAVWALWQLDTGVEVLAPRSLRKALHARAAAVAATHRDRGQGQGD